MAVDGPAHHTLEGVAVKALHLLCVQQRVLKAAIDGKYGRANRPWSCPAQQEDMEDTEHTVALRSEAEVLMPLLVVTQSSLEDFYFEHLERVLYFDGPQEAGIGNDASIRAEARAKAQKVLLLHKEEYARPVIGLFLFAHGTFFTLQ